MKLYKGEPRAINVVYPSDPLSPYGLDDANITEISMSLKQDTEKDADDAYLEKTMADGAAYNGSNFTFTMTIDKGDTSSLSGNYELCLGVQISGAGDYIELSIPEPIITIVPDKVRK